MIFYRKSIIDSPLCTCGAPETVSHFLISCRQYQHQRQLYLTNIPCIPSTENLLNGNEHLTFDQNKNMFISVQNYNKSNKYNFSIIISFQHRQPKYTIHIILTIDDNFRALSVYAARGRLPVHGTWGGNREGWGRHGRLPMQSPTPESLSHLLGDHLWSTATRILMS